MANKNTVIRSLRKVDLSHLTIEQIMAKHELGDISKKRLTTLFSHYNINFKKLAVLRAEFVQSLKSMDVENMSLKQITELYNRLYVDMTITEKKMYSMLWKNGIKYKFKTKESKNLVEPGQLPGKDTVNLIQDEERYSYKLIATRDRSALGGD